MSEEAREQCRGDTGIVGSQASVGMVEPQVSLRDPMASQRQAKIRELGELGSLVGITILAGMDMNLAGIAVGSGRGRG